MTRDRILVVTRNFPPLTGGMERLLKYTVVALADHYEVTLIGPKGCGEHCPEAHKVIECPASPALFLMAVLGKGLPHCTRTNYRWVLGGSGLVAPLTRLFAKLSSADCAILVHGLDLVANSRLYQLLFVPQIRRHDMIIANSANTREIAISKGCNSAQTMVLYPGAKIPDWESLQDSGPLTDKFQAGPGPLVLFVGRMVKRKGLLPFLDQAWPKIVATLPDARLLVVGDTPDEALMRDPEELKNIRSILDTEPNKSIHFIGNVDDDVLWRCYGAASVMVFPLVRVPGDVEGFGMVAIEAAACGTPTVAFSIGGIVDAVADGVSGCLVEEGNYDAFADAVIVLTHADSEQRKNCRAHAEKFSWTRHQQELISLLGNNTIDRNQ